MVTDEMRRALAAYSGPITQCKPGTAGGASDLHTWAQRRAVGRRQNKAARRKAKRYRQYQQSGLTGSMTFEHWLKLKPSKRHAAQRRRIRSGLRSGELVLWGDRWNDDAPKPPPWE
jgi:hypothetical protein